MSYTLDFQRTGDNGTARLLATVINANGVASCEPVEVTRDNFGERARRLAGLMHGARVDGVLRDLQAALDERDDDSAPVVSLGELWRSDSELREPVIDGLLRRGQVGNLISTSKAYKTYLILDLAICMAVKRFWLERFPTVGGRTLVIDLELQKPDITHRTHHIANAMHAPLEQVVAAIDVLPFRGRNATIDHIERTVLALKRRAYSLVIIDPHYKTYPAGLDENSNSQMTAQYRRWERMAEHLDGAILIVHHSSKGGQADKRVVDVGSGAGAQARAPDCHIALREHEVDHCVVFDAKVRSFRPPDALVLRWEYPLWKRDLGLDSKDLKSSRRQARGKAAEPKEHRPTSDSWTPERLAAFVTDTPQAKKLIVAKAKATDSKLSGRKADELLMLAEAVGLIHQWRFGGYPRQPDSFAKIPQPVTEIA